MTKSSICRIIGLILILGGIYYFFAPIITQDFFSWLKVVSTVLGICIAMFIGMCLLIFGWPF